MSVNHEEVQIPDPRAGTMQSLFFHGFHWAQTSLNPEHDAVRIGYMNPQDPTRFPSIVKVELAADRPLACTIQDDAVKTWPTALHKLFARSARGSAQLLALLDARGRPWAELEVGDQVHLFDPAGRERARILRAFDEIGSRLALRCWDETGREIAADGAGDFRPDA